MRKYFFSLLIGVSLLSCNQNNKGVKSQDTRAKEILLNSIKAYNSDSFYNSTIQFNTKDLEYKLYRKSNIADFEVVRKLDTVTYKATYNNGTRAYFVNNIEQEQTSAAMKFIDIKLEGLCYLFSIPHEFNQNHVQLKKLEDVIIKNKNYNVIHVSFTRISEEDPDDVFILYINPDTFYIDYLAEKYHFTAVNRPLFKVAHNFRTIEGITFVDYYVLDPKKEDRDTDLEVIYKLYNANNLNELQSLIFENIQVEINN